MKQLNKENKCKLLLKMGGGDSPVITRNHKSIRTSPHCSNAAPRKTRFNNFFDFYLLKNRGFPNNPLAALGFILIILISAIS